MRGVVLAVFLGVGAGGGVDLVCYGSGQGVAGWVAGFEVHLCNVR